MRLYEDPNLASLWSVLSPDSDFAREADWLMQQFTRPGAVLELGAGAGGLLARFADAGWNCVAVDRSAAMTELCRRLAAEHDRKEQLLVLQADLRTLTLNRRFDLVLLHDAVDHLVEPADVQAALTVVARHLAPQGLGLVGPTYTRETFEPDSWAEFETDPSVDTQVRAVTRVERPEAPLQVPKRQDPPSVYDLVVTLAIGRRGVLEVVEDRQRCGLFFEACWRLWLSRAGLNIVPHDEAGSSESLDDDPPFEPYLVRLAC